jgi:hypothetical protein
MYKAAPVAFSKKSILHAFKDIGLMPFDAARIIDRTELELGKKIAPIVDPLIEKVAAAAAASVLHAVDKNRTTAGGVKRLRAPALKPYLVSSQAVIAAGLVQEAKAAEELEAKELKAKRKAEKAVEKEKETKRKKVAVKQRTCFSKGCGVVSRPKAGKNWTDCPVCGKRACPVHASIFAQHKCNK